MLPGMAQVQRSALPLAIGGMLALASALGIGRFVYTPILPHMADALGLSKSSAGLIASANFLGYLVGAMLTTARRLPGGRRTWFVASVAVGAACLVAMAVASTMAAFLLLRFTGGVAAAAMLICGSALVLDRLAAAGRSALSAVFFTGIGAGIVVSSLLIDVLSLWSVGWRGLWFASGIAAGLALPFVAWLVPPDRPGASATTGDGPLPSGFWVLTLSYGLFGIGYVATATFLVAAVRGSPSGALLEPTVWVVVGLAAIPSTLAWNAAARRVGALRAYQLACLVQACGVAAGARADIPAMALIAAALLGATMVSLTALGFQVARLWSPSSQRRGFAVMTAGFGTGQVAGPLIGGALLDATGSFALPSMLAALCLVAAAAVAQAIRPV